MGACQVQVSTRNNARVNAGVSGNASGNMDGGLNVNANVNTPSVHVDVSPPVVHSNIVVDNHTSILNY